MTTNTLFMKFTIPIVLFGLLFIGCKKDKVTPTASVNQNYYQSNGNFLILVVGDTLESAYEYNLPTIQFNNDSLPISYESVPDGTGMYEYRYWKFQPNNDTLFWTYSNSFTFMEDPISSNDLLPLSSSLSFDINQFQVIESTVNTNIEGLWTFVSQLAIVKEYRNSSPNSKIGISRQIVYIYDEQLGFSVPFEKYLLFLAK